jgi:hypothetical protein
MNGRNGSGNGRRPIVYFEGVAYEMDLDVVSGALVARQVEGRFRSREDLAGLVGCSRSTVSRWLNGGNASLRTTLDVLATLGLDFDQVYARREVGRPAG